MNFYIPTNALLAPCLLQVGYCPHRWRVLEISLPYNYTRHLRIGGENHIDSELGTGPDSRPCWAPSLKYILIILIILCLLQATSLVFSSVHGIYPHSLCVCRSHYLGSASIYQQFPQVQDFMKPHAVGYWAITGSDSGNNSHLHMP
jgi:hypothetical protein